MPFGTILFIVCFLISLLISPTDSSAQMRTFFQKRHFLYGSLELDYDERWGKNVVDFKEVSQNYTLGFRSYILDPRLINYNTLLSFTRKRDDQENASSLTGLNFNMNILETPPRRWSGFRKYIPGPLMLRYSDYSNDYNYRSYGIGLIYSIPEEQLKISAKGKKDKKDKTEKDSIMPIPTMYFDYDKTTYDTGNYNSITDLYNFRATLRRNNYNYEFNYENFAQTGTSESNRSTMRFSPDYSFYDKETKKRIDINNYIKIEKLDETKQFFLASNLSLRKPIDNDTLNLSGGIEYTNSVTNTERHERYHTMGSGSYTKVFSTRLKNTTSLSLSYGQSTSKTSHSERISDNVIFEVSKILTSSSGVFLGENENGIEYGLQTQLSTKTKIRSTAGYSYTFLSYEDGDKSAHTVNLLASGPLKENISFNAGAAYTKQDVSDAITQYSENIYSTSANLFGRFYDASLSLGGNYVHTSRNAVQAEASTLVSLNGNLSKALARNIFFNLYSTWTSEPDDKTTLEIRPILLWKLRQISIDAEYKYLSTTSSKTLPVTEHRIFLKLIRRFYRLF